MIDAQAVALSDESLAEATLYLAAMDEDLARLLKANGTPPLWARPAGFATLIRIILEQQVSLKSAAAIYRRLKANVSPLTPGNIMQAGFDALRSLGITRQKASYFINVAEAIESGGLDFELLAMADDKDAIEILTSIRGVGPWTAKIYLLMVLCRPDVWPVGDIALATAVKNMQGLKKRPTQPELTEIALAWQPYRATAARMLWHYYLGGMKTDG